MAKYNKKQKDKNRIVYELTILLPAFSYMFSQYQATIEERRELMNKEEIKELIPKELEEEVALAGKITKEIAQVLKMFRSLHLEAIKINNLIIDEIDTTKTNAFHLGLALFQLHSEQRGNRLIFKLKSEITDLESLICNELDSKTINRTFDVAQEIVKKIQQRFGYENEVENENIVSLSTLFESRSLKTA